MLPPDVEPIAQPRRGDGAGIILALASAFSGCLLGFVLGCSFAIRVGLFDLLFGWIWR